jgi:hypothetical protein
VSSPIYYSRSAVTTDWTCPRKRYWNYEYANRGIVPGDTNLALFIGTVIHDGLSAIAHGVPIDDIIEALGHQIISTLQVNQSEDVIYFASEQLALTEGMLRGFHRHVWPRLMSSYPEIVSIEKEYTFEHDGLTFLSKPDLVLRDHMGNLWYLEYKTTSSMKDQWLNSWSTAVQLHSSVRAVEATIGEALTGVIVQGLYKGYVSYDKQSSPFCYAYHKAGNPPFGDDVWSYEYKAGLKKYPTWQMDSGVRGWVERMPEHILAAQFPQVPPILLNDGLINAFFNQRANREHEIRTAREMIMDPNLGTNERQEWLDKVFPQHFEQCNPGWGSGCSYRRLCHGFAADPLDAGFTLRESHHEIEQLAIEGESKI